MTPRQRYRETLLFGKPDRVPLQPGGGRESTRKRWLSEGLPADIRNIPEYAYRQAGGTLDWPKDGEGFPVSQRMIPQFEEKVLERKESSQVVQDWKGNICEIGNEFTVEYLRNAIDFVTRRWIRCPVENRADWDSMKKRYDPQDPSRFPEDAWERAQRLKDRDWTVSWAFSGPFWQLREWLGFEKLCVLFHDDPEFASEMIAFWEDFICRLLEKMFQYVVPDEILMSEDMAFKGFSMISPAMVRKFLLPAYQRWGQIIRERGCPVYAVDSDGFIGELIPLWIEAGINLCEPVEVAAGNDIVALRKQFGRSMAYFGGVDKRAMARGGRSIEAEAERITPVIRDGGYIPSCDHGVPSDVSWKDYVYYTGLLAKVTGWM